MTTAEQVFSLLLASSGLLIAHMSMIKFVNPEELEQRETFIPSHHCCLLGKPHSDTHHCLGTGERPWT